MTENKSQNKSQYITSLAEELLDDIELRRLPAESLLLKTMRLARLANAPSETRAWLAYELTGYNSTEEISLKYMGTMGRWIDRQNQTGCWIPLAQIEANKKAAELRLQTLRVPDISYSRGEKSQFQIDWVVVNTPVKTVLDQAKELQNLITSLSGISSRVLAYIHHYVVNVFNEKMFSGLSESIFESDKAVIDAMIAESAGSVLEKIPAIYNRLTEGDSEAISQALTTCRRIIDTVANEIYPPADQPVVVNGQTIDLGPSRHKNRINAYIRERTESKSRRDKLRQTLNNLYDRVSTGVHQDVTPKEAQSLFLQTYLFLGEILTLGGVPTLAPNDEE